MIALPAQADPAELQSDLDVSLERPVTSEQIDRLSHKQNLQLAIMYLRGEGREQDVDLAIRLYEAVADRGIAFAHYRLAQIYISGEAFSPDYETGLVWLERAARLGYVAAQIDLSKHYQAGEIVSVNLVEAHKWLSIAASLSENEYEYEFETLEARMSFVEQVKARYLSRRCMLKGYRDC
ncbi:MAG: tetratricopeptide repeat protein [Pseudomonadota bacterium]